MQVFRICWPQFAEDLTGQGAFLHGGRWNFKGERMLYTASNPSLAMLEMLVHLPQVLIQTNFTLVTLDLKTKRIGEVSSNDLPVNWRSSDVPESLKKIGSVFLQNNLFEGLWVPSVVMPKDRNLLLNPSLLKEGDATILEKMDLEIEKRLISRTA